MTEDFLHYIWKFRQFNQSKLKTVSGEKVDVIKPGFHNHDSGPDFFNSQIRVENTLWVGNVELHLKSSDWFAHKHQKDEAYSKIILHVVWENDQLIFDSNQQAIPTLELKGLVHKDLLYKFEKLKNSQSWIPCEAEIHRIDSSIYTQTLDQKLVERLQTKSQRIDQLLHLNKNDWESTFYQYLAKYFGFKTNAVPFELLATSLPFPMVRKLQRNQLQLPAAFFGQAGLLNANLKDEYPKSLYQEYLYLKQKFKLSPLNSSLWKFMRMRPHNFPTLRMAQFIALFERWPQLFQKIIEANNEKELRGFFQLKVNPYWENHFRFDVQSDFSSAKTIGDKSIDILLINAISPILFNYGDKTAKSELKDKAIYLLESIAAEKNSALRGWRRLKLPIKSAYDSQALLQLKSLHCDHKNCLNCTIGNAILKKAKA